MRTIRAEFCILGAGPAGLGAAWELVRNGRTDVVVADRNPVAGGLSRTEVHDGNRFDVGPHRFFTKNREVLGLWREVLGNDLRPVKRLTRIYYDGKFFLYPVSALDALPKLGPVQAGHALLSYLWAVARYDAGRAATFEDWVRAQFGDKLYRSFFKTYTEKVWGIPCAEIGATWASQRIKGLDMLEVVRHALGVLRGSRPKTLAEEFDYPRLGAGMMYERMAERLADKGVRFLWDTTATRVHRVGDVVRSVDARGPGGDLRIEAGQVLTTIPITHFLDAIEPSVGAETKRSVDALYYRDHITVNLVADRADLFPDQWIYVHSPDVRMARLANYNNFSADMAARKGTSVLGVEYFVFRTDDLWGRSDDALVALASDEVARMGLVPRGSVARGFVRRETEAYPTYFLGFEPHFRAVKAAMGRLGRVSPAGRGGLYKYNNMDHSLYSGLLAGRDLTDPERRRWDVWAINIDAEYQEGSERID